ncbi:diacylglycerol kinase family protein [Candidatus Uhrbacteria bacterium]|nr:diacylglycerol kinase family protein [Candidatus Uhrbacteria bacterium]
MLGKKIRSFRHSLAGLRVVWKEESNFKLAIVCGTMAVLAATILEISAVEWLAVILSIGFVLSVETLNTALEESCDMVKNDPDPHIAKIKDLGSAAVLLASIASLLVGIIIFLPKVATLAW